MDDSGNICLKWTEFAEKFPALFEVLRGQEEFVDVTLYCEGRILSAHRLVLAAYSPCFRKLLKVNPSHHPIIILKDTSYDEMQKLLAYMYSGQVVLSYQELQSFLDTAQSLQIQGLVYERNYIDNLKTVEKVSPVENKNEGKTKLIKNVRSIAKSDFVQTIKNKPNLVKHNDKESNVTINQKDCDTTPESGTRFDADFSSTNNEPSQSKTLNIKEEVEDLLEVHLAVGESLEVDLPSESGDKRKGISTSLDEEEGDTETVLGEVAQMDTERVEGVDSSGCILSGSSFPCPFCFRVYTNWGFRRRHLKSMHNLGGPFSCKWCDQFLAHKGDWSLHMLESHQVSQSLLHDSLMMLEEAHMVLQDSRPLKLLKTDSGQFVPSKEDNKS